MRRGPKPKPTSYHDLRGSFKTHPNRRRTDEPTAQFEPPEKPEHIADDKLASNEWDRVTKQLDKLGTLTQTDIASLELYASAYAEWRRACIAVGRYGAVLVSTKGDRTIVQRNPWDMIRERNHAMCQRLLVEFGLTPSSRARVHVEKPVMGIVPRSRA